MLYRKPKLFLEIRNGSTISLSRLKSVEDDTKFPIHHSPSCYTAHSELYKTPISSLTETDCDIVKACVDANTCKKVIREQREDNTFRSLWGKMEALADSDDIAVIEKPRRARIMAHRSSAGDIDYTAMQYFKVNVFFPIN